MTFLVEGIFGGSVLCTLLTILVKLEWLRVNFHLLGLPFNISPRPEAKDGFPLIDQRTHSSPSYQFQNLQHAQDWVINCLFYLQIIYFTVHCT